MDVRDDKVPLITAQYSDAEKDASPKIRGFYDQHESLEADREPSMDLGSARSVQPSISK